MSDERLLLRVVCAAMWLALAVPSWAVPPKDPAPAAGEKAGNITALLPLGHVVRGLGKQQVSTEAKKGDDLIWNDVVRTDKGGRARITLLDQSILSLGSQAELRILKHDPKSSQTSLELGYGLLRSEVTKVTKAGGKFEVRTPTAVLGVIGTLFSAESSIGSTTVVCVAETVLVGSSDPNIPGQVRLVAGMAAVVAAGRAPTQRPATLREIQKIFQETEPWVISALSPASLLPGTVTTVTATGTRTARVSSVGVSGTGVTATLGPSVTGTSVSVNFVVSPDAPPGPQIITFNGPGGVVSSAVFTILAAPKPGSQPGADFKAPYHDTLEQERQSALATLNGMSVSVGQSADQAYQQISDANSKLSRPMDIAQASNDLQVAVQAETNTSASSATTVDQAAALAVANFDVSYNSAYQALLSREPRGIPDNAFLDAVNTAFNQANTTMLAAFGPAQQAAAQQLQASNASIQQIAQTWLNKISQALQEQQGAAPVPKVNPMQLSLEMGASGSFDAGGSRASGSASITRYDWVLCSQDFKAPQYGVALSTSQAPPCTALPGFASSSPQLPLAACGLAAGDYSARLAITDSNNNSAVMYNTVTILAPGYDDPAARLQNLTSAYTALQPEQFLAFFDALGFPGYTSLQENVRTTFSELSSMAINLRISQVNASCVGAVLRADWELKYTFKNDSTCAGLPPGSACTPPVLSQSEQLTVRMALQPGRGWFIVDLQGDNGTLQGVPPVVTPSGVALPDLQVSQVASPFGSVQPVGVNTGVQNFQATVVNLGSTTFTTATTVHFSLVDSANTELASSDQNLPVPLAAGATTVVVGTLTIPNLPSGTLRGVTATVNPSCATLGNETNCSNNTSSLAVVIGVPDLAVTGPSVPGRDFTVFPWLAGEPLNFDVTVSNLGSLTSTGGEAVVLRRDGVAVAQTTAPVLAPGASANLSLHLVAPDPFTAQPSTLQVTIASDAVGDLNPANNTATATVQTSDWRLNITGAGSSTATPLSVLIGSSNTTQVTVVAVTGSFAGPVALIPGLFSSHISESLGSSLLTGGSPSSNVTVFADGTAVDGQYFAQVIAQFKDGAAVTAQRQATIQVAVGTGAPLDTVIVTSSAGNTVSSAPVQLNGVLAQTLTLTATRSGGTTGTVDLVLSDSPPIVSTPMLLNAIPYNVPEPVQFAAAQNADGSISPVATTVIVSSTAVTTLATRISPSPSPVGTQPTTLYFNIGDINLSAPSCTQVPPGGSGSLTLTFQSVNGFNAPTLSWQWSSLASGVTVNVPSGTDTFTGSGYSPGSHTFNFTNSNTTSGGVQTFFFAVSIVSSQGVATKSFAVTFDLTTTSCSSLGLATRQLGSSSGALGTWSRGGPTASLGTSSGRVIAASPQPDLRLSSSDVSFTPSMPAAGDTVSVRFRVSNNGDGDASNVPIALQVNGVTVASDTFDVAAGKATLGGLEWAQAGLAPALGIRGAVAGRAEDSGIHAWLVIDPAHTTQQKTAVGKSVPLAHFSLRGGGKSDLGASSYTHTQRTLLEISDGSCVGFRFDSGAGTTCGSADVEIEVTDLGKGRYTLSARNGIADLGFANASPVVTAERYSSQVSVVAGHSYAVHLGSGKTGILTVQSIRNPRQLDAKTRQVFRGAARAVRPLGKESNSPVDVGDTAGTASRSEPKVYFEIVYQAP